MQGLDDISVFVKVVQSGSFTQAARLLSMPNATVSAKVAALERRLGVTLIHRTTRKLHITQAGEAYFRRCVAALDEIQAAETEVTSSQSAPQGVLRITAPIDIGHTILPGLVREFLMKHPQMQVDLVVTNRVVDLVAEGVDVGIRAGELEDSTLMSHKFVTASVSLWASPAYAKKAGLPAHPEELSKHEMVRFSDENFLKVTLMNGKERFELAPKGRISADDFSSVKEFVVQGSGIGLLPGYLCVEESKKGRLVSVLPQWSLGLGGFSLVYPSQKFVSPKVHAFVRVAVEALK
ncbi:MAG: LysR substrate-binding domain-containing protein [Oligoflexia bacterium]|nr:LysR substrate-binding domain-containing protein [Oligoflexia bacterium]